MNFNSSIFLRRQGKIKILGGTRYVSSSICTNKQIPRCERLLRLSRNNIKQKVIIGNQNIDIKLQNLDKTRDISQSFSPILQSPRIAKYKLCNSKNVCVFSNLKKVQNQEQCWLNLDANIFANRNQFDYKKSSKNQKLHRGKSPNFKNIHQQDKSQTTTCNFKLRKMSSSFNYRQKENKKQKAFDRWHNEDHREDPDIIFYK